MEVMAAQFAAKALRQQFKVDWWRQNGGHYLGKVTLLFYSGGACLQLSLSFGHGYPEQQ